ncbi:MAG: hypothetical protein AAAB36_20850, partial [Ensifer adhaerens]
GAAGGRQPTHQQAAPFQQILPHRIVHRSRPSPDTAPRVRSGLQRRCHKARFDRLALLRTVRNYIDNANATHSQLMMMPTDAMNGLVHQWGIVARKATVIKSPKHLASGKSAEKPTSGKSQP